uniref:Putative salivary lipocalin n=1 Tax=Ixodes ricinus TaxID=34613 RepID=A0A6B0V0D2_IXORI
MVGTIKVVLLCVMFYLIGANNTYKSLLEVFKKPKDIKSLFKDGKTYYITAGTVLKGPEQSPKYDLYCGEVRVKRIASQTILEKRYLYHPRGRWTWLHANYSVTIGTDSHKRRDYADITALHGKKKRVATLYLLWLEKNTCALFYNSLTDDCESWEFQKLELNQMGHSDCSKLTLGCNKRSFLHYVSECYQKH